MSMLRILAALVVAVAAAPVRAADLPRPIAIKGAVDKDNPCADPDVVERIVERFAWEERHTWHRGFIMTSLANPRRSDAGFFSPGLILRDYCVAESLMTNGLSPPVFYAIEHNLGFASIGSNVDYCVLGLDPWYVHNEDCRTVR